MTAPEDNNSGRRFHAYTIRHLDELLQRAPLSEEQRLRTKAVASVLPFRTNAYVVDELIDWDDPFGDPMFRLVFPQEDMLPAEDVNRIAALLKNDAPKQELTAAANDVRFRLNPHPAGQLALNIPKAGEGRPTLLSFDEVTTMFHEFGHAVHGLLSRVRFPLLTRVPNDFVWPNGKRRFRVTSVSTSDNQIVVRLAAPRGGP